MSQSNTRRTNVAIRDDYDDDNDDDDNDGGGGGDGVDGDDRSLFVVYSFFVFLLSLNFLKNFKWVFFNNNNNRIVNGTSIGLIVYRYDKMAAAV